jgi:putative redox protein
MEAKVTWKHGLTFTGTSERGFSVPLGASPEVGGDNDGFRPMELMALSLAGCTAMDVISILSKKRQTVSKFEVRVQTKEARENPHVFVDVVIEFFVRGSGVDPVAVERAIALSRDKYCPAQAMLVKAVPIRHELHIEEDAEQP